MICVAKIPSPNEKDPLKGTKVEDPAMRGVGRKGLSSPLGERIQVRGGN